MLDLCLQDIFQQIKLEKLEKRMLKSFLKKNFIQTFNVVFSSVGIIVILKNYF